jgi:hypothetical protein
MDSIRITITRGCKDDGTGGTVVDDAAAILGAMPDGTPIVDVIVAAFADAYGIHEVDEKPVSLYRNLAYRCRQYMTEIVLGFASKQAAAAAQSQAQATVAAALGSVTILETE